MNNNSTNFLNYDFILLDRITKIQSINNQHNLLDNSYLSFSGGKDSTVLHYLLDIALPNNKIPRVFMNTGIEYKLLVKFVKELAIQDDRIIVVNSNIKIKNMLNTDGYPFKSKEHSHFVMLYQHSHKLNHSCQMYLNKNSYKKIHCPKNLMYQFTDDFNLKLSDKCCYRMKKDNFAKWEKANNKPIVITGIRKGEGGQRQSIQNCIITNKDGSVHKFHPLLVVEEDWENWFLEKYNYKLCELYYPPYNFTRTGCKGCPFSLNLQEDLDVMEKLLPAERKQCELLWKPVYDEYRRIGYRLSSFEQLTFEV